MTRFEYHSIRETFNKAYTPNCKYEIFTVDDVQYTNPITYNIKGVKNEDVKGSFYESELLKAEQDVFRTDQIIRRDDKKKRALVKWKGYGDDFIGWIVVKDCKKCYVRFWAWENAITAPEVLNNSFMVVGVYGFPLIRTFSRCSGF